MEGPALVIVNPSAGGGRGARRLPTVEGALARHGVAYRTECTTSLEHGRELAAAAVQRGETVLTLSGDGLAGAVAGVLAGTGTALGVLPGGRGNDLARKLGIPRDPAAAVHALVAGRRRAVDIADVDGRPFVGIASCGIDSDVQVIANTTRLVRGGLVYLYGAVRALAAWRPARFDIDLDGHPLSFSGYAVAACNSGVYGGGMHLAPDAALDDGLLDVVITRDSPKLRYLASLPKVFRGTHVEDPAVEVHRAREVRIASDRPFEVYADGDPIALLPAVVTARPGVLEVLVPR